MARNAETSIGISNLNLKKLKSIKNKKHHDGLNDTVDMLIEHYHKNRKAE